MRTLLETIRSVPLFSGLDEETYREIGRGMELLSFPAEHYIFHQGDEADAVWIVAEGRVRMLRHASPGKEVILELLGPGEVFGGAALLLSRNPATAQAATPVTLLRIPRAAYLELLERYPRVAVRLLQMLGRRLEHAMSIRALILEKVENRIAYVLLTLAERAGRSDPQGVWITIPLSREDIARMAGTTLETAIRILSRWTRMGWIRTERGGYILIRERKALQDLACSEGREGWE
ncbi:Crp/Fnr family transcriptional regulator [Thermoflexus sp.]|uniref:Crp/Fnr family transcriptional regulator n=1 Tax=Thermoflexus sp. TaxID=1969742 RepID=UPI0035E40ED2